jgi:tRNA(Ile2) C34 agmatinyltransferase TiaS
MKNVNESKKVFWQYIATDDEGVTIKVYNKAKQEELRALVEKADAKLTKELEDKKKRIEAVTLEEAEEFDDMIATLVNTDAVFVKAGKMTGRNLQIDWDKVNDKNNNTGNKQGTKQKKQLEAIRVDATFEF